MILSVSRRTDIPAFYSEWFFNRIREGFLYVRNPMNKHQVSKISLSPDVVDCIVFWSKNPAPMIGRLGELEKYMYYFQFTINPYDILLESAVPSKNIILQTFKDLSSRIGPNRVIWRYDPILLSNNIGMNHHIKYFEELARRLEGYANTCVISFVDLYKKTQRNLKGTAAREPFQNEMIELAIELHSIATKYGIKIQTCSEQIALESVGIEHGRCIDDALIEDLLEMKLVIGKDGNQRKECGCVQSIDVGEYNTCGHFCKYCYANFSEEMVNSNRLKHDPNSPLLVGNLGELDVVHERKIFSFIKIAEPFEKGDFVKVKNFNAYMAHSNANCLSKNIFKIEAKIADKFQITGISELFSESEILPIGIDGVGDADIYYDPLIAASIVFPGDPIPVFNRDYTYYLDSLKSSFYHGKSIFELIEKKKLRYVHEVQHFLTSIGENNSLKIKYF